MHNDTEFSKFAARVANEGLTPRRCSEEHFQIVGGERLVNYYPLGKRGPTIYHENPRRTIRVEKATIERAIELAIGKDRRPKPDMQICRDCEELRVQIVDMEEIISTLQEILGRETAAAFFEASLSRWRRAWRAFWSIRSTPADCHKQDTSNDIHF